MLVSHGRGGAGNIAKITKSDTVSPKDLQTPTLTSSVVTTGRGGSGNMLKNADAAETRLRQDVEPVARRPSSGATHIGRGGSANVFRPAVDVTSGGKTSFESAVVDDDASSGSERGFGRRSSEVMAKGKAWLGMGKRV